MLGDFNCHFDVPLDPLTDRIINILRNFHYTLLELQATHQLGHILDQVCGNFDTIELKEQCHTPWSDHTLIVFTIHLSTARPNRFNEMPGTGRPRRPFSKLSTASLEATFSDQAILLNVIPPLTVPNFNNILQNTLDLLAPVKIHTSTKKPRTNPWFNQVCELGRRKLRNAEKLWKKHPTDHSKNQYKSIAKEYKKLIISEKKILLFESYFPGLQLHLGVV